MNASWGTWSTSMDMAKIGQMLLNRGAYGDKRYFSERAAEAMLPVPLDPLTADPEITERGFGTTWYKDGPLSERTFGHGAASTATLRIDLDNELVIAMNRNRAGKNQREHHEKWLRAIVDAIGK